MVAVWPSNSIKGAVISIGHTFDVSSYSRLVYPLCFLDDFPWILSLTTFHCRFYIVWRLAITGFTLFDDFPSLADDFPFYIQFDDFPFPVLHTVWRLPIADMADRAAIPIVNLKCHTCIITINYDELFMYSYKHAYHAWCALNDNEKPCAECQNPSEYDKMRLRDMSPNAFVEPYIFH